MNGAFYIGAIGLDAQQQALDVVANNIANVNTSGFKRQAVQFTELVSPADESSSLSATQRTLLQTLSGTTISATPRIWTQGSLNQTNQPLDIAISGDGFLELMGAQGQTLLWRGGSLKVNPDGYLAAADGTMLRTMISVPQGATNLTIGTDGTVSALVSSQTQPRQLGQLEIAMVKDPTSLIDSGNGYFEAPEANATYLVKPGDEGGGTIVQGALETSNVQLTNEMVTLLLLQRAYSANAQVVQAGDQLMSIVNGLRR